MTQIFLSPFCYKGIIFDLDGTLYEKKGLNRKMISRLITRLRVLSAHQKTRESMAGFSGSPDNTYLKLYENKMQEKLKNFSAENWLEKFFYPAFIAGIKTCKRRPGLVDFLKFLQQHHIKLAILSDYGKIKERLHALHLDPSLFSVLYSSEENNGLKPNPDLFLNCAKAMNLTANEVLVIGDRDDRDGQGARQAGMDYAIICKRAPSLSNHYTWLSLHTVIRRAVENIAIDKKMKEKTNA